MNTAHGFRCRACGFRATQVTNSRPYGAFETRRRRLCKCGNRFTTYEIDHVAYKLLEDLKSGQLRQGLLLAVQALEGVAAPE